MVVSLTSRVVAVIPVETRRRHPLGASRIRATRHLVSRSAIKPECLEPVAEMTTGSSEALGVGQRRGGEGGVPNAPLAALFPI